MPSQPMCFNADVQIGRRVEDPGDDNALGQQGALIWTSITTVSAMPPCVGTDVQLVHGDEWRHIEQNVMVNILGNNTVNITQNENYTVTQNRTTNIVGNYTKTIIGVYNHTTINAHIQLNVSVRNNTFVSPKTETHCAPKQSQEPTGWMESVTNFMGNYVMNIGVCFFKSENQVQAVVMTLSKFEIAVIETLIVGSETDVDGMQNWVGGLKNKVEGLASRIQAAQPSLGAIKGHVVATTLKTIVLGVNQYI